MERYCWRYCFGCSSHEFCCIKRIKRTKRSDRLQRPIFLRWSILHGITAAKIGNPIASFSVTLFAGTLDCHIYQLKHNSHCCRHLRVVIAFWIEPMGKTTFEEFQHEFSALGHVGAALWTFGGF